MEMLKKNKGMIAGAVVLLLLMFGYSFFAGNREPATTTGGPAIGANMLRISKELSQAALNQEVLSDPRYLYLIDFSTIIPEQPKGRANPFNVIGQ